MVMTGDWIVPHLNYVDYLEKPPLAYWITAISYKVFGAHEWQARLPNAACYLATCFLMFGWSRTFFGSRPAFRAGWMCATALLPILMGRFLTPDFMLTFFLSAALCSIGLAETGRAWPMAILRGWICVGVAALAKDPAAIVIAVGTLAAYRLSGRVWTLHAESEPEKASPPVVWHVVGCLLALLICFPWGYTVGSSAGPIFRFFIFDRHLWRLPGAEDAMLFWFYVPVLAVGFFPWTAALLKSFTPARFKNSFQDPSRRWCWCWACAVFIFFSAAGGKRVMYILPFFAPMAVILATETDRRTDRQTVRMAAVVFVLLAAVLAVVSVPEKYEEALDWGRGPLAVLFAVAAGIALWLDRTDGEKAIYVPALAICLFVLFLEVGGSDPDAHRTAYSFRRRLQETAAPIISYGDYFQSLNFYSGKRVIVAGHPGELSFGSQFPDAKPWFWTESQMAEFLATDSPALIVMKANTFHQLFQASPRFHLLDQAASLVLVSANGAAHK